MATTSLSFRAICVFLLSGCFASAPALDKVEGEIQSTSDSPLVTRDFASGPQLFGDGRNSLLSLSYAPGSYSASSFAGKIEGALQVNLTQRMGHSFLHMSVSDGNYGTNRRFGGTFGKAHLLMMYGDGDGLNPHRQGINGITSNFFHGAASRPYRYTGAAMAYAWTDKLASHAGTVAIAADSVKTRSVHYGGVSYGDLSASYYAIDRDGDRVGNGATVGLNLKSVEFGYEQLDSEYDARWRQLSLGYGSDKGATYRLSLGSGRSGQYREADETRVTLTYQIPLGERWQRATTRYQPSFSGDSGLSMAAGTFDQLTRIGVGAAGMGLSVSSGDPILDAMPRFATQPEAAYAIVAVVNPFSVRENLEYGGSVFRNPDGTYSPTELIVRGIVPYQIAFNPHLLVPPGTRATAAWHTHGAPNPNVITEFFSPSDIQFFEFFQIDGYLGTPMGRFLEYQRATQMIFQYIAPDGNEFIVPN